MPATLTTTKNDEPAFGAGGRGFDDLPDYGGGDNRQPEPERQPPPEGYRIGLWLTLASVTMLFAALTSAYVVNRAHSMPIVMPKMLWLSTAVILASSATFETCSANAETSHRKQIQTLDWSDDGAWLCVFGVAIDGLERIESCWVLHQQEFAQRIFVLVHRLARSSLDRGIGCAGVRNFAKPGQVDSGSPPSRRGCCGFVLALFDSIVDRAFCDVVLLEIIFAAAC
jgi:hypothetical protein